MQYTIEKATPSDVLAISLLVSQVLGAMNYENPGTFCATEEEIVALNAKAIFRVLKNMYVAKSFENKILGVCGLEQNTAGDYYHIGYADYQDVSVFVVDPAYRGQHIGSALMKRTLQDATKNVICESWGDTGKYANAHYALLSAGFNHLKSMPKGYYENEGWCPCCVHRHKCQKDLCTCDIYERQRS